MATGSKFGFGNKAASLNGIMRRAMGRIAEASKNHFVENFAKQSYGNEKWEPVKRNEPPPPLNVTGELLRQTQNSVKTVDSHTAVLENTATDSRGRRYSNYHNEGTDNMPARPIMKQDDELTKIQLQILKEETGKVWTQI